METIHTGLIWLAVWVASSIILSPLIGMWIKNANYSLASRKLNRVRGNGRA
jgi:hypothetical protein